MQYKFSYGGIERLLPVYEVSGGFKIAYLDTFCDLELVNALSQKMAEFVESSEKFRDADSVVILTAVSKGVPFAYTVANLLAKKYCGKKIEIAIARKEKKKFYGETIAVEKSSITSDGASDTLVLAETDVNKLRSSRTVLLDDMYSTGASIKALDLLAAKCNAEVIGRVVAVWETGDDSVIPPVQYVTKLPLIK